MLNSIEIVAFSKKKADLSDDTLVNHIKKYSNEIKEENDWLILKAEDKNVKVSKSGITHLKDSFSNAVDGRKIVDLLNITSEISNAIFPDLISFDVFIRQIEKIDIAKISGKRVLEGNVFSRSYNLGEEIFVKVSMHEIGVFSITIKGIKNIQDVQKIYSAIDLGDEQFFRDSKRIRIEQIMPN